MRPIYSLRHASRTSRTTTSLLQSQIPESALHRPATRAISTIQRPRHPPLTLSYPRYATRRAFNLPSLSSFLPSTPGGSNNDNNSPKRVLTATRTLPNSPAVLFKVISSVESYSQFLPFLTASTVTARDPETGHPTQAFLTVGYGPLSETFTSKVDCDPVKGTVEARSGARFSNGPAGQNSGDSNASNGGLSAFFPGANEGIFEYLSTRWELAPLTPADAAGGPSTKVHLEVRFEFRNQMHAALMSAMEGQMASVMIEAFEKRIRELYGMGK